MTRPRHSGGGAEHETGKGRTLSHWRVCSTQIERSPPALIGRRAKFREETPVTRQNERPSFILSLYCLTIKAPVQKNITHKSMFFDGFCVLCLKVRLFEKI